MNCALRCLVGLLLLAAGARAAEFAGTGSCAGCHAAEHQAWQGSHHDLAMQHAGADTVLGDFADARFSYDGVTSRFRQRDGRYFVVTDGPDGELAEYEVGYTFGVTPLQQYLVEFPDGRVQALGIAWDARPAQQGGQRWFHLYPDQQVDHDHELHWTRSLQNWNYMCAGCHSTNLVKGYDATADRFDTTWTDIDVGCEACHGPGAGHLRWAALPVAERDSEPARGFVVDLPGRVAGTWRIDSATGSATVPADGSGVHDAAAAELAVCAACHSRRGEIAPEAGTDGRFLDHYMPAFLTDGLYHADGQIEDEVFVWGSFRQSRMHEAGVRCSDCHEPHTLALRAPGAAVCGQCHLASRYASEAHHHHPPDSAGADCLECHMPATTYMVVDPRRDHSLRIPRPDLSETLGVPNACSSCHDDRPVAWAAQHYQRWCPTPRLGEQTWGPAFSAARAGNPAAEAGLVDLSTDTGVPDIARATALLELAPFLSPRSGPALQQALRDASPLVRIGALRALEVLAPEQRYPFVQPLLSDALLAVRSEAGRVVAAMPEASVPAEDRAAWRRGVADYEATQTHNADRPEAQTNLASLYAGRGETARAQAALRRAIALDQHYTPAYANLADLLRGAGDETEAVVVLEQGLAVQPDAAALHHALGLARVRAGDREGALDALGTAWRLAPQEPRFAYVYAIAQNGDGAPQAGRSTLREGLDRHPYDRDLLLAAATISRDMGDMDAARRYARRMVQLRPDDAEAVRLAQSLGVQ